VKLHQFNVGQAHQYEKSFDIFFEKDLNFRQEEDKYNLLTENDCANARRLCTLLKNSMN